MHIVGHVLCSANVHERHIDIATQQSIAEVLPRLEWVEVSTSVRDFSHVEFLCRSVDKHTDAMSGYFSLLDVVDATDDVLGTRYRQTRR